MALTKVLPYGAMAVVVGWSAVSLYAAASYSIPAWMDGKRGRELDEAIPRRLRRAVNFSRAMVLLVSVVVFIWNRVF